MMPSKKKQIFLLHFAGGNGYSFHFLKPHTPAGYELHALELPGRGKRMREKLVATETEAIADLLKQINALRNEYPYLIFGHSMGASLGLRITKRIEDLGDPPERLIVGGNAGPGTGERKCRSKMNDEELKAELRILGGVPEEVLENEELFAFFSPIMKSDFALLENSAELGEDFKLRTPITAVMGSNEETVCEIENWKRFTSTDFKYHLLEGNHFFILDHPTELLNIITQSND